MASPLKKILLLCLALLGADPIAAQSNLVVIVHPSNMAHIDEDNIANIFLGQTKTFPAGGAALAVDLKDGPLREDFGIKLLHRRPPQLKALWARQIFTGGAKPPRELANTDEVLNFVASTPGAIAYVDAESAKKANASIKIVLMR
jgi:ABC-type phosphate transport system substrate-binding protein